jgi:hypothetical protein
MSIIHDVVVVASVDCAHCGKRCPDSLSMKRGVLVCDEQCLAKLEEPKFGQEMEFSLHNNGNTNIAAVVQPLAFTLHRRTKEEKVERDRRRVLEEKRRAEAARRKYEEERRKADAAEKKAVSFNVQNILLQNNIQMPELNYEQLKRIDLPELNEFESCILESAIAILRKIEK